MYEQIKTKENYNKLLASGMFWEFHPELTGSWEIDKEVILADGFTCQACNHHLPIEFNVITEGFCYLCDQNITLEECLSDEPLEHVLKANSPSMERVVWKLLSVG